ncbi:CHRD domain containing protein [Halalkalicoccus jeotgali B3]|uniref:CHRD domain containing protein n=1 Tax=Halalkalicoccus jeotgali (strain DSM 18796 / CECT 7217 / JCM 14584 / KCTC 4019 / B3) TaxID=795797 RepID=D8J7D3_HALJB|nr:CHRD domain containing protein [Halalkalicoccus jeotgali B3]ELY33928.1 CHRD domain containing protein [Halalkalicoccus jeotgali B3]
MTIADICNVTQAHIHLGSEGEDGPVVAWLYPEGGMEPERIGGRFSGILTEDSITAEDLVGEWEVADFEDVVGTFEQVGAYVNVHTEQYPDGEIRGQILPPHE